MDDREILQRIGQLVDDEHEPYQRAEGEHGLSEGELARLRGLEVLLDQCWDLLRQRRARRTSVSIRTPPSRVTRKQLRAIRPDERAEPVDRSEPSSWRTT
jgi:hypothetical protein